eukprot:scaffold5475_cov127-Isochrysis_galbana.AAC.1
MGDPSRYPEIRMARFMYAMQWLAPDVRADYGLRQQWIDNNMTYLDALLLALYQDNDSSYMSDTWPEYNSRKSQLGRNCEDFRGVRLLGFWALGRHAVPSICTRKTIGRHRSGARADRAPSVLQPPILSYKALGLGRTLARSYLAGFFGTRLPPKLRADYGLRQQWIDNNLTYLDAELLELYLEEDNDYMTFTWPEYHHKHACRLGICPNYLFDRRPRQVRSFYGDNFHPSRAPLGPARRWPTTPPINSPRRARRQSNLDWLLHQGGQNNTHVNLPPRRPRKERPTPRATPVPPPRAYVEHKAQPPPTAVHT